MQSKICLWVQDKLEGYVRKKLSKPYQGRVAEHIRTGCAICYSHLKLERELARERRKPS